MLTNEHIHELAGPADYYDRLIFARAIEAEATAPLFARIASLTAQVEQAAQPVDVDTLTDKIASMLGLTYHCTRVWDAWHVGTMSQDDFEPVDESDTPREIAEEIFKLYTAPPKEVPLTDEQDRLASEAVDAIMTQAQVFASAYSLIGGRFDGGNAQDDSDEAKAELRTMVVSLAYEAANGITPATVEK